MDEGLPTLESVKIGEAIKSIDNVENCEFVSKDEAVKSYIEALEGDGDILAGLTGENNPLPDAFKISLKDLSIYEETAQQVLSIEGVQKINDYSEVANKLTRLDTMVKIVAISVVTVLGIVSLFIIANTIRVTMHSRRLEISIMKSVGATNGFVRVPFLVEGALNRMYFRFDFQWFGCIGIQLCNEGYLQPDVIVYTIAVINSHSLDYFSVCWGRYFIWNG